MEREGAETEEGMLAEAERPAEALPEPQFDKGKECPLNCPVQDLPHAIMNSEAVSALIAKSPSLKAAKAKLEAMEPGAYVVHRSWGFGQIKKYDEGAQKLLIDFKGKKGHPMDPAFCISTMDVLSPKDLRVRKETDTKAIDTLIAENPGQRRVLVPRGVLELRLMPLGQQPRLKRKPRRIWRHGHEIGVLQDHPLPVTQFQIGRAHV